MLALLRLRCPALRRPFIQLSTPLCQLRKIELPKSVGNNDQTEPNPQKNVFFTNSREGDWVCPNCGVLSFAWRQSCFKCGTLKPSAIVNEPSPSPKTHRRWSLPTEQQVSLKELLVQSQKSRNYDLVIKEIEKILNQKKIIKSSVVATMISAFGKSGKIERAIELFNDIGKHPYIVRRPTPYHYAATITACSENGKWETALDVFDHMRVNSRNRSIVVCASAMTACNNAKQYNHVIRIYNTIKAEGWLLDTACYNIVLDSFVKIGNYTRALEIYEEMRNTNVKKDARTYGVMLECCNRCGDWVLAHELLKQINLTRNIPMNAVMYTSAIMAFVNGGEPAKALELYAKMKSQSNILIDYPLYSALLHALSKLPPGQGSGVQSLETLKEMTKRHIKLSAKIVTTVIACLDKDEMYDSAMILYDMARGNGMFVDIDPKIVLASSENLSSSTEKVDRRIDFRNSSSSMIRAILRSIFTRIKNADATPKDDYLLVLGTVQPLINSLKYCL